MTRISQYMICGLTLLICHPSFSQPTQMMLSLNEAKHYHAKPTGQIYIQADKFQRKSNANYYKLIVQSAVKSPVRIVHQQGYYSVAVGPLASVSSIRNVADKLKYDPGLTASKHPSKVTSSFTAKHAKKPGLDNHKKLAVYDRSTLTDPMAEEPTTTPTEPSTTVEPPHTESTPSTDQSTTESTTNTEQSAPAESAQETPVQQETELQHDTQIQQDSTSTPSDRGAEQSAQESQPKLDEQPKEVEKTLLDKKTQTTEPTKPKPAIKADTFKESAPKQSRLQTLMNIYPKGNWIVSAGVGASDPSFGSSMAVSNGSGAPAPADVDIYTTKSRTQPIAALSLGYRWVRDTQWLSAFSLNASYQHLFSRNVGNQIMLNSNPGLTNYTYDWELSSDILMALLKANIFDYRGVSPYVLAGAGAAFNRIGNYSEVPLSGVTARTSPAFGSNTMTNFAYRVGVGLEYQIDPQFLVSMEYQFQSIGNITSDYGTQAWAGQYLNLGSYQSNAALLTVTYLFGACK